MVIVLTTAPVAASSSVTVPPPPSLATHTWVPSEETSQGWVPTGIVPMIVLADAAGIPAVRQIAAATAATAASIPASRSRRSNIAPRAPSIDRRGPADSGGPDALQPR